MKVRVSWLKDYVHLQESVDEIKMTLTMLGFVPEDSVEWGPDDYVLDLEITVNRPDMLSHLGVARELSVAYHRPLTPGFKKPEEIETSIETRFNGVTIEAPEMCHRYVARVVTDVNVGPSPDWIRDRLESVGIRPINNVVDATNYVMLAYGQPLHAFDLERLDGHEIRVRFARKGEKIRLLDESERELDETIPVIADARNPVAIAGIMGGLDSSVHEETHHVLIESAWFDPRVIRRARRALDLQTDASYRFERGADIGMAAMAADYAAYLIAVLTGGRVLKGAFDAYPKPFNPPIIRLRFGRVTQILGVRPEPNWVEQVLEGLGFQVDRTERENAHEWKVQIPSFRRDVAQEIDLIEEIGRHYGYDRIPETLPDYRGEKIPDYPEHRIESVLVDYFAGRGFMEHMSTSFVSDELLAIFDMGDPVIVQNPISDEDRYLRTCLAMGLIRAASWNHRRQQRDLRLWELGNVFWLEGSEPVEHRHVGLVMSGLRTPPQQWRQPPNDVDFFDLKGEVNTLLQRFQFKPVEFIPSSYPFLHPHQQVNVFIGKTQVGYLGRFHPKFNDIFELRSPVYVAEICLTRLMSLSRPVITYQSVSDLPVIQRDLSIVVNENIPFGTISSVLNRLDLPEMAEWHLIDIYRGDPIPEHEISYTLRFLFTPTILKRSEEIESTIQTILQHLEQEVGARLR